jgi:hypothetical protein
MATHAHCRSEVPGSLPLAGQRTTTVDHLIPQQLDNRITSETTATSLAEEHQTLAPTHAQHWTRSDIIPTIRNEDQQRQDNDTTVRANALANTVAGESMEGGHGMNQDDGLITHFAQDIGYLTLACDDQQTLTQSQGSYMERSIADITQTAS